MNTIQRFIKNDIINHLRPGKVVVIYGPRQIGKKHWHKKLLIIDEAQKINQIGLNLKINH
jgi:predicted AAA+ superfamily ATPase